MAGKGLHSYTVQEAQNATMGQAGSVFLDATGTTFTPTPGRAIVAITFIQDTSFDVLTPEDSEKYFGITGTGYESKGNTVATADVFPAGLTIYGRWTSVSMTSAGMIVCYMG
jgi:hypothetical protein